MEEFRSRGARLEYWFIKVRSGELSFLVDWIVRRGSGEAEVRISLFVRGAGRVLRTRAGAWRDSDATVARRRMHPDAAFLQRGRRRRPLGPDLRPGRDEARPGAPAGQGAAPVRPAACRASPCPVQRDDRRLRRDLHPRRRRRDAEPLLGPAAARLAGCGCPPTGLATGTGWWRPRSSGLASGATAVAASSVATPCSTTAASTTQILAPTYGHLTVDGTRESFEIDAWTRGRKVRLTASAPRSAFNDLGEGIHQTLLGDVTVHGWGSSRGSAGLEFRGDLLTPG